MASVADAILKLHGQHQDVLAALSDEQAKAIVDAYAQARSEIVSTLQQTLAKAGSSLTPAQVVQVLRSEELVSQIDQHLAALQSSALSIQETSWQAGAELGLTHANAELALAVADFGGAGIVGRSIFGSLNTLAYDLGMTAALNETQNLSATLRLGIQRELQAGAIAGEGIRQLTKRIDAPHLLNGARSAGGNRAELIARYSTIKGHNAARDQAYNDAAQSIPGLQKEWICSNDERTCPHCLAHHGEVVDVDGEFDQDRTFANKAPKVYGGVLETPPLHPRCRCTIVAWHPRWAGITSLPPEAQQEQAAELAQQAGLQPKTFLPPKLPKPGSLRATRAGRAALRAKNIASVPKSVRDAHLARFRSCWLGSVR